MTLGFLLRVKGNYAWQFLVRNKLWLLKQRVAQLSSPSIRSQLTFLSVHSSLAQAFTSSD